MRKLPKRPITTHTMKITSTSDEKSHVNPLKYTRAKNTDRQRRLFMVTAPYSCDKKQVQGLERHKIDDQYNKSLHNNNEN